MTALKTIFLGQSLHGYSDGHQLLASSIKLSRRGARDVLVLSDLSGTVVRNFDGYVTAYFLPSDNLFAFAKTWYAFEQPRPGSVWTHTIYLEEDAIESILALDQIVPYFRRPDSGNTSWYHEPLTVQYEDERARIPEFDDLSLYLRLSELSRGQLSQAVREYYLAEKAFGVLPAETPEDHEFLYYALWRQAWPKLRKRLSFCTCAAEIRYRGDVPLDLQSVPTSSFAIVRRRAISTGGIVIDGEETDVFSNEPWLNLLLADLGGQQRLFRRLTMKVGDLLPPVPRSMIQLARFYSGLIDDRADTDLVNVYDVLNALVNQFPRRSQGVELKRTYLNGALTDALGCTEQPAMILRAALETVTTEALNELENDVRAILRRLHELNKPEFRSLVFDALRRLPSSQFAELCVESALPMLGEEDLRELPRDLLVQVLARTPSLLTTSTLRDLTSSEVRSIAEVVAVRSDFSEDIVQQLVATEIKDRQEDLAADFYLHHPGATVGAVLDCASKWPIYGQDRWTRPLASFPSEVARWLIENPYADDRSLKLIAGAARMMRLGSSDEIEWHRLVERLDAARDAFSRKVSVIVVILALYDEPAEPKGNFGECFLRVYDRVDAAVSQSRLSEWEWYSMHDQLPKMAWWEEWDRAKRLRLGALQIADKYGISYRRLISVISDAPRAKYLSRIVSEREGIAP